MSNVHNNWDQCHAKFSIQFCTFVTCAHCVRLTYPASSLSDPTLWLRYHICVVIWDVKDQSRRKFPQRKHAQNKAEIPREWGEEEKTSDRAIISHRRWLWIPLGPGSRGGEENSDRSSCVNSEDDRELMMQKFYEAIEPNSAGRMKSEVLWDLRNLERCIDSLLFLLWD